MMQHVAIYCRVSKRNGQDVRSQLPDLERWTAAQDQPIRWYRDRFTGKTMDRPGWRALESDIQTGKVSAVVCWRIDRLGRTAKGLTSLFSDLQEKRVNLVSLKDGLDLSTPAGRLMANVLASVAQFETEVRAERILAGQAAARAAGKTWGGGKPGRRVTLTEEKERTIKLLHDQGKGISEISRVVGLSRPTIYRVLGRFASA
ncbi:MAG: recombinase family protein [Thermoguttaceae bacterium]